LDLKLPPLVFRPASISTDLEAATQALRESISDQLDQWHRDPETGTGGAHSGYRIQSSFVPSNLENWDGYVSSRLASDLRGVFPDFEVQWAGSVTPDPLLPNCQLLHLALENLTLEPQGTRAKELEVSLFNVSFSATL